MKKNLGLILIVVGALLMVLGYVSEYFMNDPLKDQNWFGLTAWLVMVAGLALHIVNEKKAIR